MSPRRFAALLVGTLTSFAPPARADTSIALHAGSSVVPLDLPSGASLVVRGALFDARDGSLVDALSDGRGGPGLLDLEAGGLIAVERDPAGHVYRLAPSGRPCLVPGRCPAAVVNLLPLGTARLASVEELRDRLAGRLDLDVEVPPSLRARAARWARGPEAPLAIFSGLVAAASLVLARRAHRTPTARARRALRRIDRARRPAHAALRAAGQELAFRTGRLALQAADLRRVARRSASPARAVTLNVEAALAQSRAEATARALEEAADGLAAPSPLPAEAPLFDSLKEELDRARQAEEEADRLY